MSDALAPAEPLDPAVPERPAAPHAVPDLHLVEEAPTLDELMASFASVRLQNSRVLDAIAAANSIGTTDLRAVIFIQGGTDVMPKHVAAHLGLSAGAMTTLIDRIENAGFVRRAAHPTDRRSLLLEPTELGRTLAQQVRALYTDVFRAAVADEDVAAVHRTFRALERELGTLTAP